MPFHGLRVGIPGALPALNPFAPQSTAFFARLASQPDAATKARYDTMIRAIVASGAWTLLDFLSIYAAADSATALTNLVQASYGGTVHGTMTFAANVGYQGDGNTGYIDTGFTPSTAAGNFSLNSATLGVAIQTNRTTPNFSFAIGTTFDDGTTSAIIPMWGDGTSGTVAMLNNNDFTVHNSSTTTAKGMWVTSLLSNAFSLWKDNTLLVSRPPVSVNGPSAFPVLVGAARSGGNPGQFSTDQISAAFGGAGLTSAQISAVSNAINNFLAGASVNVFSASSTFAALSSASLSSIFSGASTLPLLTVDTHQNTTVVAKPIPDGTNVAAAQAIGAQAVRLDCNWIQTEASAGSFDFSSLDPTVNAFRAVGITVHLIFDYGNTLYGAAFFTGPADATYRGHYNTWVTAAVNHFGSTGFIYEIWNEPNLGSGGYAWAPTPSASDYSALLTGAAAAIKAAKPAAIVLSGGLSPGTGIAPNTFIATVAGGTLTNVDGFGYHPYNAGLTTGALPEQLISDFASFKSAASSAKPIYVDEVGYSMDWTGNSETVRAKYVARLMGSACIAQSPQVCIYDLFKDGTDPNDHESNFGLYDYSFNPLPAATAYTKVAGALSGMVTNSAGKIAAANLYELTINKSVGRTRMIWTSAGAWRYTRAEGAITSATATDVLGNPIAVINDGSGNISFDVVDANGPVILAIT